jgi:hypothetical protein
MTENAGGWSPAGIASAIAIVAGIVLLMVYARQRGLLGGELDGSDENATAMAAEDPTMPRPPRRSTASRPVGTLGAILLVAGLALGTLTALGAWGTNGPAATGPGGQAPDCAQTWSGCPKATPNP